MKKTIKSTCSNLVYDIERADWNVKFRTPENYYRHTERRVWISTVGFNMFVEYKGAFYMVGRTDEHGYITSIDFTEVSAEEAAAAKYESARELADKAQRAEAATSAAALDYDRTTVEEQAREAHFSAMAAKNNAEAARRYAEQAETKEAFVFVEMALEEAERARQFAADATDIAENYTDEGQQATERKSAEPETAAQISEATKEASRAASDAEKAAREVVEARDICDADAADNRAQLAARYATEAANRYDADEVTRAEANNAARAAQLAREALTARVLSGITEADAEAANSGDYAERLAREAVQKAGGNIAELKAAQRALIIVELISDEDTRAHLEVFATAHQWSPQETRENVTHAAQISAADAAAARFCAAYENATGNPPYFGEAASVCRVARDEITGSNRATSADYTTVSAMVDSIAEEADAARFAARAEAREAWDGEGLYILKWSDGGQSGEPTHYETVDDMTRDLMSAYQGATETHLPYMEHLEYYERHELEAFLGDVTAFDVEAIEQEATATDQHGSRYWTAGPEELAAIAERHQL